MRPQTHSQRLREACPRAVRALSIEDRARRRADPTLAQLERLRATGRWTRLREFVLVAEPLCRECGLHGRVTVATQVDHVVPAALDVDRFFDLANLQPLCTACHATKSAQERAARRDAGRGPGA